MCYGEAEKKMDLTDDAAGAMSASRQLGLLSALILVCDCVCVCV